VSNGSSVHGHESYLKSLKKSLGHW